MIDICSEFDFSRHRAATLPSSLSDLQDVVYSADNESLGSGIYLPVPNIRNNYTEKVAQVSHVMFDHVCCQDDVLVCVFRSRW